ncbi:MAG TPA: low molecular weight phosphatase family protein [Caulobacteraceae bacterium]|nr:low molecular weight phosphatase family protein [Caulobacteraceae bacterium]
MTSSDPPVVLFACNLNRVRSPMAAALAQRLGLGADSCGLSATDAVDPFLAAVMLEVGVDLSEHQPKTFADVNGETFDLIIALTPEARERLAGSATPVEYWPTADPTLADGSREQRLDAYREVRRALQRRLSERFGAPST